MEIENCILLALHNGRGASEKEGKYGFICITLQDYIVELFKDAWKFVFYANICSAW